MPTQAILAARPTSGKKEAIALRTQFVRKVSLVIVLAVVMTLAVAPAASAIPTVRVTGGVVGSGAGLSGLDVCYGVLGADGCSLTGDATDPVLGATTYSVPLTFNSDTDTYAGLTTPEASWPSKKRNDGHLVYGSGSSLTSSGVQMIVSASSRQSPESGRMH